MVSAHMEFALWGVSSWAGRLEVTWPTPYPLRRVFWAGAHPTGRQRLIFLPATPALGKSPRCSFVESDNVRLKEMLEST